jgi:osmoprotectant transport system ATP-binding protein
MAAAGITFTNVSYTLLTGRTLLRDINLTLETRTITAILGRSGSGKTTLLRMVNALVMPTSGEVRVGDQSTATSDPIQLRRSIGYVIQETGLFPHRRIGSNVGMPLEIAGKMKDMSRYIEQVEGVMKQVGLDFDEFAPRYPLQLSGGQRQRAGVARALAADPAVLLMDEPFGALDPLTRAEMQTMLRDLLARVGKTVLLVTHDLDEALYLAQRVVFLDAGEVVADLPAADVLQSPNPHVRNYVNAVHRPVKP